MRSRTAGLLAALAIGAVTLHLAPAGAGDPLADDVAGVPAALIGDGGPTQDWSSNLTLLAHSEIPTTASGGGTQPLGNHGAVALIGDCAYVGRWHDYTGQHGVQILDVSRVRDGVIAPAGSIAETARNGGVAREIRAVDLPGFKMLVVMQFSQSLGDRSNNMLQLFTVGADCTKPALAGSFNMAALRGHEFFLWLDPDPLHDVDGHPRVLAFVTVPPGPPSFLVVDLSRPTLPVLVGAYELGLPVASPNESGALGTYAHSVAVSGDGREAYLSYWDGGFLTVDTTAIAALPAGTAAPKAAMSVPYHYGLDVPGNTHSAVRAGTDGPVVVGDEIYATTDGCPYGWMRVIDPGSETQPPAQVGEFRLAENRPENCSDTTTSVKLRNASGNAIFGTFSMHNQTVTERFALATWYGGGLRVVDIGDPSAPVEAGAFVPAPVAKPRRHPSTSAHVYGEGADDWKVAMWSYPVIRDGLIFVTDVRNGLYVLEPAPGASFASEVGAIAFLEGNSNVGDFAG